MISVLILDGPTEVNLQFSEYGLDVFYGQPGIEGAHEKGGVEGQIGWFRRNHLVPVPHVESFELLNAMVDEWDAQDDGRRIGAREALGTGF